MRSQLKNMLKVWLTVIDDASTSCALPIALFERDISRAERCMQTRGLGFFTLDLPALDGVITSLLENGTHRFQGQLLVRRSKRDLRPRFLWALWSLVCDANGCLLEEPSADAILFLRQLSCFFKKYEVACSPSRLEKAVGEFYAIENNLPSPTLKWDEDRLNIRRLSFAEAADCYSSWNPDHLDRATGLRFLRNLDRVSAILVSSLGYFDSMSENTRETGYYRHGPGAVSDQKRTSYKYDFPNWPDKLEGVFPFDWCGSGDLVSPRPSRDERPSSLLAVPKTAKGPRLIASEPVSHQWCQQKVSSWLEARYSRTLIGEFITLSDQGRSASLVVQASIDRSLSTIDLSSASDRISCHHIERLLASSFPLLEAVHAVRTRYTHDKVTSRGYHVLKKFSSMGSALTFPIQSLFFLSIALAACGCDSKLKITDMIGKVRVYGDDIIVPTDAYEHVTRFLHFLGLKVNQSKSFSTGSFRESCGMDAWRGFDVTPCKPKSLRADTPTGVESLIALSNSLYFKGFWKTSDAVLRLVPNRFKHSVFLAKKTASGSISVDVSGVISLSSAKHRHIKYDAELQRNYVRIVVAVTRCDLERQNNSFALRDFFSQFPSPEKARETGLKRIGVAKFATAGIPIDEMGRVA